MCEPLFAGNTAFIMGNEGDGMTANQKAICDGFVYIRQYGEGRGGCGFPPLVTVCPYFIPGTVAPLRLLLIFPDMCVECLSILWFPPLVTVCPYSTRYLYLSRRYFSSSYS